MTEATYDDSTDPELVSESYRVPWADRFTFVRDMLGLADYPAAGNTPMTARMPHQHPDDPKLYANRAEIEPENMAVHDGEITFGHAIVTVTYAEPLGITAADAR
jgi:hypothetical protein